MKIDLDKVEQGDSVWHDRYGWGVVARVQKGTCDVQFPESRQLMTFTEGGMHGKFKVLYWQPPMLYTPRKRVDYTRFLQIVDSLHNELFGGGNEL